MLRVPEWPMVPAEQRATGKVSLRYEDVSQDGRVVLDALPHSLGEVIWAKMLQAHPITRALMPEGVVPILTRVTTEGGEGPIAIRRPMEGEGCFEVARAVDERGATERILLNLWVDVFGLRGRTYGPAVEGEGERVRVGRVFAEHVFTRPFAPRERRKVLSLDYPGAPEVATRCAFAAPEALLALPEGAIAIDDALVIEPAPVVFGLDHTDSNQHVNSLVYPRLFQEAALRRLAALGRSTRVLARFSETAYRKPCFAGDRAFIALRMFTLGDDLGALGAFLPDPSADARPHCCAVVLFRA